MTRHGALLNLAEMAMRLREVGENAFAARLVESMPEPEAIAAAPVGAIVRVYVADAEMQPVSLDCTLVEHLDGGRLFVRPTRDQGDLTTDARIEVQPMHVARLSLSRLGASAGLEGGRP